MTAVVAPEPTRAYPVRLTATAEPDRPSRGLWLVKWLLVIPHAIVLAFLWLAFAVLTVVAFVAILVTGRYPRAIFDFTVGVLRWSWRVSYYAYGNLGTDRYPPFSLRSDPDYPADLHVEYPERLSRGLVLVKSWLLAIPHWLILGALTGSGAAQAVDATGTWVWRGPGLLAVLALIAGVALLFTGRLPQGLYDLLLGLNRWALRVTGYAALMTDAYPPFRLDQGGPDRPVPTAPPPAPAGSRWTAGPILSVVGGALALAVGLGMATGAGVMLAAREDGFVTSPTVSVETEGYAVVTDVLRLEGVGLDEGLGQVRLRAEADDDEELFLGIGAAEDVRAYLAGVERSVVRGPWLPERNLPGGPPAGAPEDVTWLASTSGPGRQELVFEPQEGSWLVVLMPADLEAGLSADVDAGAEFPWVEPAAGVLLALGLGLMLAGAVAMALGVRAASHGPDRPAASQPAGPPPAR
ncbi:MAG: DUF4389 domain-containing protein [Dermatophilaceae bacterium]